MTAPMTTHAMLCCAVRPVVRTDVYLDLPYAKRTDPVVYAEIQYPDTNQ